MDLQVLDLPLRVLKIPGLDPRDNSPQAKLRCFISLVILLVFLVTAVLEMRQGGSSITSIVPEIEAVMATMEGFTRWFTFVIFKKRLSELIQESKTVLDIKEADPGDNSGAGNTMLWLWKGIRIYVISVFFTSITTSIVPILFASRKALPFTAWFPRNYPYGYEVFYEIQILFIIDVACTAVGADGIFGAFCGILIAQFKLLNRKLENTKHIETNRDFVLNLQEGVRYHLKLIKLGEMLGNIFSIFFLVQYMITLIVTCVELYTASENMNDMSQIARFLSYMSTVVIQMGIYCFLADAVTDESQNTAMAVYRSDWYSKDIKEAGLYVQMIIRRASKAVTFSGGGLILISRVLWLHVFKMAFSVFILLRSRK